MEGFLEADSTVPQLFSQEGEERARGDGAGFLPPPPPDAPARALPSAASLGSWPLHRPASIGTSLQPSLELSCSDTTFMLFTPSRISQVLHLLCSGGLHPPTEASV